MDKKRREFLKIAGLSTLAGLGGTVIVDELVAGTENVESKVRYGMLIDLRKFKQHPDLADKVIQACNHEHNVPDFPTEEDKVKWVGLTKYENAFDEPSSDYNEVLVMCNHCDNPPCVLNCPTRATFKNKEGLVVIDHHRCIGCRQCISACPYGMRSFNWRDPRDGLDMDHLNQEFPTRRRGVVENCNFCAERLGLGQLPACAEACGATSAIVFGDLNDPTSEISWLLKAYETIQRNPPGPRPSVFYIV